jgi:crossover junction endodeoxyribonuclease RusA
VIEFVVYGRPATAGSKRGFPIRRAGRFTGRVVVVDDSRRTKSWQAQVRSAAVEAGGECLVGPLKVAMAFHLQRPLAHYGTGRNAGTVRDAAPAEHVLRPDLLKLARAIEDALTGVLWRDDAQVCVETLSKHYTAPGSAERVCVRVTPLASKSPPLPIPGQLEIET